MLALLLDMVIIAILCSVLHVHDGVFMIMLASDKGLMGPWANRRSTNALGIAIITFVSVSGALYGVDSFLHAINVVG